MKAKHNEFIPVDCRGSFPEHLFGLQAAALPPAITGWMLGLNPFYQRDGITIFRGDCKRILKLIPPVMIGLLCSDPPYGINLKTDNKNQGRSRWNYKRVRGDDRVFDPSHLLAYDRICLWGANYYAHALPRSTRWAVWDKREGRGQNCQSDCEVAWLKGLPGVTTRTFYHMWNGACRASERDQPRQHPTQKPEALMRWCIQLFPDVTHITDPYAGSGTTLVAAKQLGIPAIGIEYDEQYCRAAADRVEATSRLLN